MAPQNQQEERFVALETKLAYQEKLLSELHEVLLSRGKEIDGLLRRVDRLERLLEDGSTATPGHERPPHY